MNKNIKISYNIVHEIDNNLELIKELQNKIKFNKQNWGRYDTTKAGKKKTLNELTELIKEISKVSSKFKKSNMLFKLSPTASKIIIDYFDDWINKIQSHKKVLNCGCARGFSTSFSFIDMTYIPDECGEIIFNMRIYRDFVKNTVNFCNKELKLNLENKK